MLRVISGSAKGRKLIVPEGETRAVTDRIKTSVFDLIQDFIKDADVLDLFAGSGAYGIEALSRGSKSATFIDNSEDAIEAINENLSTCGFKEQGRAIKGKLPQAIEKLQQSRGEVQNFDLVFCDPPFTKLTQFNLQDYKQLITPDNLFILRIPDEWEGIKEQMEGFKIEYEKRFGLSRVLFIRNK